MKKKTNQLRTAVLVCVIAVCAVALLLVVYFHSIGNRTGEGITLPAEGMELPNTTPSDPVDTEIFLTITRENVLNVIRSLQRPSCYHQTFTATIYWEGDEAQRTVDLYCQGDIVKGVITEPNQTKHILSNGTDVYVWYEGETDYFLTQLPETTTIDDILGLPTYETVLELPEDSILEASYVQLDGETPVSCIYIACQLQEDGYVDQYWVDVKNQTLYRANAKFGTEQIYEIQQTAVSVCASGEEVTWDFRLPDGSELFGKATTETEMPQP